MKPWRNLTAAAQRQLASKYLLNLADFLLNGSRGLFILALFFDIRTIQGATRFFLDLALDFMSLTFYLIFRAFFSHVGSFLLFWIKTAR